MDPSSLRAEIKISGSQWRWPRDGKLPQSPMTQILNLQVFPFSPGPGRISQVPANCSPHHRSGLSSFLPPVSSPRGYFSSSCTCPTHWHGSCWTDCCLSVNSWALPVLFGLLFFQVTVSPANPNHQISNTLVWASQILKREREDSFSFFLFSSPMSNSSASHDDCIFKLLPKPSHFSHSPSLPY